MLTKAHYDLSNSVEVKRFLKYMPKLDRVKLESVRSQLKSLEQTPEAIKILLKVEKKLNKIVVLVTTHEESEVKRDQYGAVVLPPSQNHNAFPVVPTRSRNQVNKNFKCGAVCSLSLTEEQIESVSQHEKLRKEITTPNLGQDEKLVQAPLAYNPSNVNTEILLLTGTTYDLALSERRTTLLNYIPKLKLEELQYVRSQIVNGAISQADAILSKINKALSKKQNSSLANPTFNASQSNFVTKLSDTRDASTLFNGYPLSGHHLPMPVYYEIKGNEAFAIENRNPRGEEQLKVSIEKTIRDDSTLAITDLSSPVRALFASQHRAVDLNIQTYNEEALALFNKLPQSLLPILPYGYQWSYSQVGNIRWFRQISPPKK